VATGGRIPVIGFLILLGLALAGCSSDPVSESFQFTRPETAISYQPEVQGAPSEEVKDLLSKSLGIFRRAENGAQSVAFLRRRAEGDIEIAQKILRSYGYYEATVSARVEGTGKTKDSPIRAIIMIEPGRPYILEKHTIHYEGFGTGHAPPDIGNAASFGSPVGATAQASLILQAEIDAEARLQTVGYPYAEGAGRDALADTEKATIEIDSRVNTGPFYRFGPISFEGAPNVDRDYLLTYLPWAGGDTFDASQTRFYQREMMSTGLFKSGQVSPPAEPPDGDVVPITVTLEEAPARSISIGARYFTDTGPEFRLTFEHRNLFGANERLNASLRAGTEEQSLELRLRKPQYLRSGQDLTSNFKFGREDNDAFTTTGFTGDIGLERKLGPRWTVGLGLLGEYSVTEDVGKNPVAILGGVASFAEYDSSDDLLDPTRGQRLRFDVIPFFGSFDDEPTTFLHIDTRGSAYYDILDDKRYILAGRFRAATIVAEDLSKVPPNRRLYSGGGGSVRGYAERFIGPVDALNSPTGGLSALELNAELRARVYGDLGIAIFTGAGSVSQDTIPSFEEGVQVAAGFGLRYASPVGPLRLDFALPVNGRAVDDNFQIYISIGQAY